MRLLQCIINPNLAVQNSNEKQSGTAQLQSDRLVDQYLAYLTHPVILQTLTHFHQSLPQYQPTPLIKLSNLSQQIGIANLLVKDESKRFELNAFKMLGASFAIAQLLAKKMKLSPPYSLSQIIQHQSHYKNFTFATATDGNHGRALAWCANLFGCHSRIYMPKGSSQARIDAIKRYTPLVEITDLNYDDTVAMVADLAGKNHWQLIQDTAWENYTEIPDNIMRGYFSLIVEFEQQSKLWPTHVFLQAGVGSMAAAVTAYFVNHSKPTPKIIIVEPNNAPCFFESIKINNGHPHSSGSLNTLMAGLACGLPSTTAWHILSQKAFAFIKCHDRVAVEGMKQYANPIANDHSIISGESAAVTLGVLMQLIKEPNLKPIKQNLEIDQTSQVLLLSTEGDTDPQNYRKLIEKP
jgi:diaminopropionate ammonia-lyase